ncbi:DUF6193 family natural product biosynthesis protein [Kitasatospora sp. NPDC094011]|uniref:DUF6193 family natural product biosynthesis protein n=1 Tax=Kitasatospora sp. NPDC094011 TaxID=3364090 RepID=UPI003807179E
MNTGVGHGKVDWDEDGALRAALGRTAEELGLVLPESDREWGRLAEYRAADGGWRVTVCPPDERRRTFEVSFQQHGSRLAFGQTGDLTEVARATAAWTGGAGLAETRARAPFVRFRPWALAHEQEPFDAVELMWQMKLDRVHMPPYDRFPRVHALLAAAYAQPVLRGLMPVNSHFDLWFSNTVDGFWETQVGYTVRPHDEGRYGVWDRGELVARTETPEEAVALVVAALPEGVRAV